VIQVFGTKKCAETRKAERFFKERNVKFQAIDLAQKGMSEGELRAVAARVGLEKLLDRESPHFRDKGLGVAALTGPLLEKLLVEDPLLLKTPIVRNGREATVGYSPGVWAMWLSKEK
jgi:arsenate reductase-like glutaredoxin family protein